jgi:hypothetical protein
MPSPVTRCSLSRITDVSADLSCCLLNLSGAVVAIGRMKKIQVSRDIITRVICGADWLTATRYKHGDVGLSYIDYKIRRYTIYLLYHRAADIASPLIVNIRFGKLFQVQYLGVKQITTTNELSAYTGSPHSYERFRSWREFVKRVTISHKRNVKVGGYFRERPKNNQKKI